MITPTHSTRARHAFSSRLKGGAAIALFAVTLPGLAVVNGGFEQSPFTNGWSLAGKVIQVQGLHQGSESAAWLAGSGTTRLGQNVTWQQDWFLDFYFALTNTSNRAFSLLINVAADAVNVGTATINLRYQAGQFNAFASGDWGPDLGLGSLLPSTDSNGDGDLADASDMSHIYRFRVTGHEWGTPDASYDLALSEPNATNFTRTATNLKRFQNGSGTDNPPVAFIFNTLFGANPGFWVDSVTASTNLPPAPETNATLLISGTYPHLSVFTSEGECGIGAVASWNDALWFVTYPPHHPGTGPDKLWTIDTNLTLMARSESVGGTHANRFIHRESQQLIMGPYFINTNSHVRAVSRSQMPGRLTGTARHLTDPTNKVLFATMEEGFYDVDVNSLAVTQRYPDSQGGSAVIPGYHGKGLYTSQGRIIYSNNGEPGWSINNDRDLAAPAGALAEHTGQNLSNGWNIVERKNFCEVTGPGGIYGPSTSNDPVWATGWDKRSAILKLLDSGVWRTYRLPKGSFTHDALHGWYTEWPRIREIVDGKMLMHMHGLFYDFPKTFSAENTLGIRPICTYLKMPVDYCWWNGQLVMARDDTSTTGGNSWAGQSHSAPWFGQLSDLEQWGPPTGFGGPWKRDTVVANTPSDPFLVDGFQTRLLHLKNGGEQAITFNLETLASSNGSWTSFTNVSVPPGGYTWLLLPRDLQAAWARLTPDRSAPNVTAWFHLANPPRRPAPQLFSGIAEASEQNRSEGIIRPRSGDARTLQFAATLSDGTSSNTQAYYEIDGSFQLRRTTNSSADTTLRTTYGLNTPGYTVEESSVLVTEGTNRFRLPKSHDAFDTASRAGWPRGKREVVTERNMFQAHGTFYELPREDAGGFRRVRPITTHNRMITDYGSWRGLFVIAGLSADATTNNHVFRSDDGKAALWFGNVDDLWRMGIPAGTGGPWKNSSVTANVPSDPYLMFGYEQKLLQLSHESSNPVVFRIEVDVAADNSWSEYSRFTVQPGQTFQHAFPEGYTAHWVRIVPDTTTKATARFTYGPTAPRFGKVARLQNGTMELTFTGAASQPYTLLGTTNTALPRDFWEPLHTGTFQANPEVYLDGATSNFARRFYTVVSPTSAQ